MSSIFLVIVRRSQQIPTGRVNQHFHRSRLVSFIPTADQIREELDRTWYPPRAEVRVNGNTGEREVVSSIHIGVASPHTRSTRKERVKAYFRNLCRLRTEKFNYCELYFKCGLNSNEYGIKVFLLIVWYTVDSFLTEHFSFYW